MEYRIKRTKQKQKMRRISSHQKTKKRRPPVGVCPCSRGWMLHMINIAVTRAPIIIYLILTIIKECQRYLAFKKELVKIWLKSIKKCKVRLAVNDLAARGLSGQK